MKIHVLYRAGCITYVFVFCRRKTEIISHLKDAYYGTTKTQLEVAVQNMWVLTIPCFLVPMTSAHSVDYQVDKENIRRLEFIKGDGEYMWL